MTYHKQLEVINVGQGDCMILRPQRDCVLFGKTYIIDTGDGTTDFTRHISNNEHISLVLTHSHQDHTGGIIHLLPRINQIKEIIMPFYYDEITLIAKAINSLLGIDNISHNSLPIKQLNEYQISNTLIQTITTHNISSNESDGVPKIILGFEGFDQYKYFEFLNPPVTTAPIKDFSKEAVDKVTSVFERRFAAELNIWLTTKLNHRTISDTPDIKHYTIYPERKLTEENAFAKGVFVFKFFKDNFEKMLKFVHNPTIKNLSPIVNSLHLTANQASLVFRFDSDTNRMLFTGDIDTTVFNRIISNGKEKELKANILKVPHHGSKTGLNNKIIKIINPDYAIICHNNKKFGRAKDPHPNIETIELLEKNFVEIFVTNDIVKNNVIRISRNFNFSGTFEIVDEYRL